MIAVCCFLFTVCSTHVNYMPNVLTTFFLLIYSYLSIPRVLKVLPWRIRFRVFCFERLRWETMHLSFKQLTLSDGIPIFLLKLEPEPVPSLRLRLRNIVFLQYEYIKCTQYTYISPVAFRWMQKGEWTTFTKTHWLPYRTCDTADCIHHQKYCKHICCFPACILCNTYAMWTISFVHLFI